MYIYPPQQATEERQLYKQRKATQIGRRTRTTNEPHSVIRMKEEGKGDSNEIRIK